MNIAEEIKIKRKKYNLTKEELAKMLNVEVEVVSSWEEGATTPTIEELKNMNKVLELDINSIFELNNQKIIYSKKEERDAVKKYKIKCTLSFCLMISGFIFYIIYCLSERKGNIAYDMSTEFMFILSFLLSMSGITIYLMNTVSFFETFKYNLKNKTFIVNIVTSLLMLTLIIAIIVLIWEAI